MVIDFPVLLARDQCGFNEEHESKVPMYKDIDQYLSAITRELRSYPSL